jgi:hypothetical protein
MNPTYYTTATAAPAQNVGVGLNLPVTILGLPTWLWVVGGAVFFLVHKGKI